MSSYGDAPLPFTGGRHPESDAELALAKRRILLLHFLAPALSCAAIVLGFARDWIQPAAIGVIGLGATALVIGERAISERRLMFMVRGWRDERRFYVIYEGLAAIPFGLSLVILAASSALPALAVLLLGVSPADLRDQILAHPSYALIPLGLFLCSHALGFIIGFADRERSRGQRIFNSVLNFPARLGGLILLFWGALALAVGLYERIHPESFDLWIAEIAHGHLPFGM